MFNATINQALPLQVPDLTSLATLVVAIGTLVMAYFIYRQTKIASRTTMGDFTLRLHNEFFMRSKNAEIIRTIEEGSALRRVNGGRFDDEDLDDFLGIIELLNIYIEMKLLEEKIVDEMFGYYIVKTYYNKEIQEYIREVRRNLGNEYYRGVVNLAQKFK